MLSACLHCVTIELFIYEAYIGLKSPQRWLVVGYGSYGKIGFDPIATERRLRRNGRRQRQRRYGIFHVANVISLRKLRWLRNSLRKIRETDYGTDGTDVTWGWKPGISPMLYLWAELKFLMVWDYAFTKVIKVVSRRCRKMMSSMFLRMAAGNCWFYVIFHKT